MLVIGCTGGIGSGKSTVSALLAAKGATIIDADAIVRNALEHDAATLDLIRARFGDDVFRDDGTLDRHSLAGIVFHDASKRRLLEALLHPVVETRVKERLAELEDATDVAIVEAPLLVEVNGRERYGLDGLLVVDAPQDLALERLVEQRGMDRADAESRIAAQIDRVSRIRAADFVILNVGTTEELAQMVDNAWRWIEGLALEAIARRS